MKSFEITRQALHLISCRTTFNHTKIIGKKLTFFNRTIDNQSCLDPPNKNKMLNFSEIIFLEQYFHSSKIKLNEHIFHSQNISPWAHEMCTFQRKLLLIKMQELNLFSSELYACQDFVYYFFAK